MKLPELPKADGYGVCGLEQSALYSADRMRAYGEMVREECARFIESEYVRQFTRPWREDLASAIRRREE